MSLTRNYSNQYPWRRWSSVYPVLGDLAGKQLVDMGCGIGDQARDLSRLGADVLGVDANQEFISHAQSRGIPRAHFLCSNITDLKGHELEFDGVWSSFTAAYFTRFDEFLNGIGAALKPGAWLAITEVDDLFGQKPLDARLRTVIEDYYARSLEEGVYRFRSHDHVCEVLAERGWHIEVDRELEDDEFCFAGPASSEILGAWKVRLDLMMPLFQQRFGERARGLDAAFLKCLAEENHLSRSRVWFILARPPGNDTTEQFTFFGTFANADARRLLDAFVEAGIRFDTGVLAKHLQKLAPVQTSNHGAFGQNASVAVVVHADDVAEATRILQMVSGAVL